MKYIQLGIELDDELVMKSVEIQHNDTEMPNDSKLLKATSVAMLKSIIQSSDSLAVQDLLHELGIDRST